jgi:hypothetical protein
MLITGYKNGMPHNYGYFDPRKGEMVEWWEK